ncbi:hypothetical protein POM88_031868 [Heracleum sosnowskyi]|uniref:Uncharacterized protein n=1 Tax=Heracleum sosnowskyi TaxID=360622 RepID=A0AAD8MH01_9APIA|nr:hypothetical protein POM88_031868 [Heracleum sosnowskyi]
MASQCSSTMLKAFFLLSFLVASTLIGMSEARQLNEKPNVGEENGKTAKMEDQKTNESVAHVTQSSDSPPSFPNIPFFPPFPSSLPKFPQIPGLPPCPLPTLPFLGDSTPPPSK